MLEKIKEKFNGDNLNKKLFLYVGIGVGALFILLILLFIIKAIIGSRISADKLEEKIKTAAISYYDKEPELLPKENGSKKEITINELVEAGELKSLDKLLKKGLSCSGHVTVSKNNGFYSYIPYVDCGNDYKTNLLVDVITNEKNIVTTGNGLYKVNDYYLFRGENLNNYVSFAGKKWVILRVNSDKTIRLLLIDKSEKIVWDDRYNTEKKYEIGKNDFNVSRIKDSLENYFKSDNFTDDDRGLIVPMSLCIGKRNANATVNDGSIECSKVIEKQPLGLLQLNEYFLASLEQNCNNIYNYQCKNYNYLSQIDSAWSITADASNSYKVYRIYEFPTLTNASSTAQLRVVTTVSSDIIFTEGNGSIDKPYVIK